MHLSEAVKSALIELHGPGHRFCDHWLIAQLNQVDYIRATILPRIASLLTKPLNECRVLDLGCGSGGGSVAFALEGAKVVGVEHNFGGLGLNIAKIRNHESGTKVQFVAADACSIPIKAKSIDLIFCNQVVEHIREYRTAIKGAYEILDDDGLIYVSTINRSWIMDGHSFLPFVNWMPNKVAEIYVKVLRRRRWGDVWDVWPISSWKLRRALVESGFTIIASADHFVSSRFRSKTVGKIISSLGPKGFMFIESIWPVAVFAARKAAK